MLKGSVIGAACLAILGGCGLGGCGRDIPNFRLDDPTKIDGGSPDTTPGEIVALTIAPSEASLEFDENLALEVKGTRSDGSEVTLFPDRAAIVFGSSDPAVATVDPRGNVKAGRIPGSTLVTVTLGPLSASSDIRVRPPGRLLVGIDALPDFLRIPERSRARITVTGFYSDGNIADLTFGSSGTTYEASQASGVTVDENGVVEGLAAGSSGFIRVTNHGFEDRIFVEVTSTSRLIALDVRPPSLDLEVSETAQLTVRARFEGNLELDVTSGATGTEYVEPSNGIASVSVNGQVHALAVGAADIRVRYGGIETVVPVRVQSAGPEVTSVRIRPTSISIRPNVIFSVTIFADFGDGSTQDVTSDPSTTASTDDVRVARYLFPGSIEAVAVGRTTFRATFHGKSAEIPVEVTESTTPTLLRIELRAPNRIPLGEGRTFSVTGIFSDSSTVDLTFGASVVVTSDDPSIIGVEPGFLTGLSPGRTTITARHSSGLSDSSEVRVVESQDPIVSIFFQPGQLAMQPGGLAVITLQALHQSGATTDITSDPRVTYSGNGPISLSLESMGLIVEALAPGAAEVEAVLESHTAFIPINIGGDVDLAGIQLQAPAQVQLNGAASYRVFAVYSDGNINDITFDGAVTVTVQDPSILAAAFGTLLGMSLGTTTLTASYQGFSESASVSVVDQNTTIAIFFQPAQLTLRNNSGALVTLSALRRSGSSSNVSLDPQTMLSVSGPITVVPQGGSLFVQGMPPGGIAQITATYQGFSAALPVTVGGGPTLVDVRAEPSSIRLGVGGIAAITVTAVYSDGSEQIVTGAAMLSIDPSVASVDALGIVTGISPGNTGIFVAYGNFAELVAVDVGGP